MPTQGESEVIYRIIHRTDDGKESVVDDGWYDSQDAINCLMQWKSLYTGKLVLQRCGWADVNLRWIPPTEGRFEIVE